MGVAEAGLGLLEEEGVEDLHIFLLPPSETGGQQEDEEDEDLLDQLWSFTLDLADVQNYFGLSIDCDLNCDVKGSVLFPAQSIISHIPSLKHK